MQEFPSSRAVEQSGGSYPSPLTHTHKTYPAMSSKAPWGSRLAKESGFRAIVQSGRDTKLLCLQRFVRLYAYGASFLILAHFLSGLGFADERIGLFMTLTLLGDVVISLALTAVTDRVGRRRVLGAGAASLAMSGLVFAASTNYWLLLFASVVGVISPSGNEIGPFRAIEESVLAQLTAKDQRSDIFAWYTLFGTAGAALGTLTCGWAVQLLEDKAHWSTSSAHRAVFVIYAVLGIVKLGLVWCLGPAVEVDAPETQYQEVALELEDNPLMSDDDDDEDEANTRPAPAAPPPPRPISSVALVLQSFRDLVPYISPLSRSILYRLLVLFSLDSFASGIASPSWLTYFFTTVHSLSPAALGTLFLATNLLATLSNLAALPMARRLGPLRTMVFTHLPSAVFLALIALPPASPRGTPLAMTLLALRACTQSMDQAPRQAFLAAAVLPAERTAVLGVVNITKTLAQAGGIGSSGVFAARKLWVLGLGGAGLMKAAYDLLMLWMFLGLKEREAEATAAAAESRVDPGDPEEA
ncbi:major facilitator superfamily MFS1 [Lasiosphaeria miniovina]|uniref:Major facilitator superfamily MFS1 n=1 Tax=Lasiosphaeria miniovina TaxID=1954250 RepID=A0AA40DR86_9PEZI|nr:major facilitator superfamily MFS1 [Lasiosphaeria miniovina]KAK0712580.1 major facilitator superfamily MFS1 [Lasiosphaeria miniovina]